MATVADRVSNALLESDPHLAVREVNSLVEAISPGAKVVKDLRTGQRAAETQMEKDLSKCLDRLGAHVASVAADSSGLIVESFDPVVLTDATDPQAISEALSDKVKKRVELIIKRADPDAWAKKEMSPIFGKYWRFIGNKTRLVLERHDIEGPRAQQALRQLVREGSARVGLIDMTDETRRAIFNLINDAVYAGWDNKTIAQNIKEYVPQGRFVNAGSRYRAEMIARTEMMQAQNRAALDRYRNSSVVIGVTAYDGDGDPICIARNGKHFTLDEAQRELGITHPNCVLCFGPRTK